MGLALSPYFYASLQSLVITLRLTTLIIHIYILNVFGIRL